MDSTHGVKGRRGSGAEATQMLPRVLQFVQERRLLPPGETVVMGVSGGPDSVCLFHLLTQLRETLGLSLHLAHLDHGLRGEESQEDARYVAELARSYGISATIERRDVSGYQAAHRLSWEEAARRVRYTFFAQVAQEVGTSRVAVGHTADDQVETVLLHLIRGTGLVGLQGMQPATSLRLAGMAWPLVVVRPLLGVRRRETQGYCELHGLSPRQDSTNRSPAYRRNRVRHELLPLLERYNPRVGAALLRAAHAAAEVVAFLDSEVARVWDQVVREEKEGLVFRTGPLADLPGALQTHLLRRALERFQEGSQELKSAHLRALRAALVMPAGKRVHLAQGLTLVTGYGTAMLSRGEVAPCPLPPLEGEHWLQVPGIWEVEGWRVQAQVVDAQHLLPPVAPWRAHLDLDVTGPKILLRTRRRGDRFWPLGMGQAKKLQDFLVDAKVPRHWRDRVPIVASPQHILWVVGWRLDQRARVGERTRQVIVLDFQPIAGVDG